LYIQISLAVGVEALVDLEKDSSIDRFELGSVSDSVLGVVAEKLVEITWQIRLRGIFYYPTVC
jgi:hypothetical protein